MTQWVRRDVDALCVSVFGRLPQRDVSVASFSLAAPFAGTIIVPAVAARVAFVDKLQFSVDNTGLFAIDDGTVPIYATAGAPTSALGGVEHIFERVLWARGLNRPITFTSPSAGSTFSLVVLFRYV